MKMENGNEDSKMKATVSIENALQATGFGKFNYFLIIICGILSAELYVEMFAIGLFLPASDCDLSLTVEEKGIVAGAQLAGMVVSSYLWGFVGDTIGRRKTMIPAIAVVFVIDIITSFLSDFLIITIVRFLNGFFVASVCSIPMAYLGEFHTNDLRSKAIMYAMTVNGFFMCTIIPLAWLIINQTWSIYIPFLDILYKPWRLHVIVNFLPFLLCGVALIFLPESPKFTLLQKDETKTLATLRKVYRMNTGIAGEKYPYDSIHQEQATSQWTINTKRHKFFGGLQDLWYQTVPLFKSPFLKRTILLSVIQFIAALTTRGLYMWYSSILNDVAQYERENPGNWTAMCNIIREYKVEEFLPQTQNNNDECKATLEISTYTFNFILEFLFLTISLGTSFCLKYFHKIHILLVFLTITGICGVIAPFIPIPLLATIFLVTLHSSSASLGIFSILIVDLFPTNFRSMAGCITFIVGCLGGIFGSNIVALLLKTQCETAFVLCGLCMILSGLLSLIIIPMERKYLNETT